MTNVQPSAYTRKWASVLNSNLGRPMRNRIEASVTATLLETQNKLNKGQLMESANVSSDVAQYQQYALPLMLPSISSMPFPSFAVSSLNFWQ